jgi:putative Mg2+ transporter-C (MgtC) family protein
VPTDLELLGRLGLAILLGGVVGAERTLADQPAGLRTHVLLTLGACLFTLVSAYGFEAPAGSPPADPTRIAAQIVSGIGFLGGGAILRQGLNVRGLTTAASIWATASIGVAVGAGMYVISVGATMLILLSLAGLKFPRNLLRRVSVSREELVIRGGKGFRLETVTDLAKADGVTVRRLESERDGDEERVLLAVRIPAGYPTERFLAKLNELPGVLGVDWEK